MLGLKFVFDRIMNHTDNFEITTNIGCPVNCLKYCPQEVLVKRYEGPRSLTFETFKKCIASIPKEVCINFAGYSEPLANPETPKMLRYAYDQGHLVSLFTTLMGASTESIKQLCEIKFYCLCLHMPDGINCKVNLTEEYMRNFFYVIEHVRNTVFMTMNDTFSTNNRENVVRGILPKRKKFVRYCNSLYYPNFILLPNGNVQLCCMDFGLQHTMGNLLETSYNSIKANFLKHSKSMELCHYCSNNIAYYRYGFVLARIFYHRIGAWSAKHIGS